MITENKKHKGVSNLYTIHIKWSGTNLLQALKATKLYIRNTNLLNLKTYHSRGFNINSLGSYAGYRSVGTCTIPSSVKTVWIKTFGLQAYFYNDTCWFSTGNINGYFDL